MLCTCGANIQRCCIFPCQRRLFFIFVWSVVVSSSSRVSWASYTFQRVGCPQKTSSNDAATRSSTSYTARDGPHDLHKRRRLFVQRISLSCSAQKTLNIILKWSEDAAGCHATPKFGAYSRYIWIFSSMLIQIFGVKHTASDANALWPAPRV